MGLLMRVPGAHFLPCLQLLALKFNYTVNTMPVRQALEAAHKPRRRGANPPGGRWCWGAVQPSWATAPGTLRPG